MDATAMVSRFSWTLVGAIIVCWAFLLFGYSDTYFFVGPLEVLLGLVGLAIMAMAWLHTSAWIPRYVEFIALGMFVVAFLAWCWIQVRVAPAYGTDEVAFDQYAAQLFQHGHDPYAYSMAPSFDLFHVSPNGFTFRLDGTPVTQLSYPSLSFLVYVPFLLVGLTTQTGIVVNCLAWVAAVILAYFMLPRAIRPLVVLVGSLDIFTGFAVGGVTDALYVPFLLVAVYRWDRYRELTGWRRWIAPAAMGCAMGFKQTPWLVGAFLVVALALDAYSAGLSPPQSLGIGWRFIWRTAVVFVVPNAYFIAANPHAWLKGILTPLEGGIVPAGQGWIALSNFIHLGGGNLRWFSVLGATALIVVLVGLVVTYPRCKPVVVFLPSLVLFFVERSFASYLIMLLLPFLVGATSVNVTGMTSIVSRLGERGRAWGRRAPVVAAGAFVLVALAATLSTQPLSVRIDSVQTTGQLATVIRVQVSATNHSAVSLRPVFASQSGGALSAPWSILSGPSAIAPGSTGTYELSAPNYFAQPQLTGGFQMAALTQRPAALSISSTFSPTNWHTTMTPQAVETPVVIGVPVVVKVQILNPNNSPVRRRGIPVYLGQVTYAQGGVQFSQAVINQSNVGETPVEAVTDAAGVATFSVVGTQATVDPVYFEANLINTIDDYPYGYSPILAIRYVDAHR